MRNRECIYLENQDLELEVSSLMLKFIFEEIKWDEAIFLDIPSKSIFFEQMKNVQTELEQYMLPENYGKKEKQS